MRYIIALLAVLLTCSADARTVAHRRLHFRSTGGDADTVFLCHFDGADQATSATDVATGGSAPHAISFAGTSALSTVDKRFGTASLTSGNGYAYCAGSVDFSPGTDDFTVELWFKTPNSTGTPTALFSPIGPTGGLYAIDVPSSTHLPRILVERDGSNYVYLTATTTVNDGAWHHIALVRHGDTWTLALDGVAEAQETRAWDIVTYGGSYPTLRFGCRFSSDRQWDGWIDEVRISRSAQYVSFPFTPSGPFTP